MYSATDPIILRAAVELLAADRVATTFTAIMRRQRPQAGYPYNETDVQHIVAEYYAQAAPLNIDPIMALAQVGHETGWLTSWWSARPRRNPAGIGVTGHRYYGEQPPSTAYAHRTGSWWYAGVSFKSWKDAAIPAHLGRLLAWALPVASGTTEQRDAVFRALTFRPLPGSMRGTAQTWADLGGRWAVPGNGYGQRIATAAIVLHAGRVRT